MLISAKVDYAIRALMRITEHEPRSVGLHEIAVDGIPARFIESILAELRQAEIVRSARGQGGGYALARSADAISLGQIIRVVHGPLTKVRGLRPDDLGYQSADHHLTIVWTAIDTAVSDVLDATTLRQLLSGNLPEHVLTLSRWYSPDAEVADMYEVSRQQ